MSQNRPEGDALAETQLIRAIPPHNEQAPRAAPAAQPEPPAGAVDPLASTEEVDAPRPKAVEAPKREPRQQQSSPPPALSIAEILSSSFKTQVSTTPSAATPGTEPAARTEAPRTEPARSEPSRSTAPRTEPLKTEPARAEPARPDPPRAELPRTAPAPAVGIFRPRLPAESDFSAEQTAIARVPRQPIPVPPEFLTPPPSPDKDKTALHGVGAPQPQAPPAPLAPPAPPAPTKPARPDDGGFSSGPPKWQDHVPFDETGVLLRPEALRHHAMQAETELISAIKLTPEDDGSEAAKALRPGFWTGAWPRRALLTAILLLQAMLTLRNNNSAFEDEALYLYSGHLELGHLLYGTSIYTNFWTYFSGAPTLYPVLGSIADQIGGLFAARLLSLAFMLGTTSLLYLLSRRMFGTRAALSAAALFSFSEAAIFVGGLATYDAPALFLLALAAWIVVRFAKSTLPFYLIAVFPAALAVGTKYAALMFVPVIVLLALFAAVPYAGKLALVRPAALAIGFGFVIWALAKIAGPTALQGVQSTTTARAQGTNTMFQVLQDSLQWSGAVFAVSVIGGCYLVLLPHTHRHPALPAARWQRVLVALLLAGTALLPVAYQAYLHTTVSLQKHVGFGLFFAAPLAGYGLVRLVGSHFHRVQLGIGVIVLTFALGMGQSLDLFHGWPNSNTMVSELVKYQKPGGQYLVEADEVAIYALRGDPDAEPTQFSNTFYFGYTTAKGQYLSGTPAFTAAIQAGYFQAVIYNGQSTPAVDQAIAAVLYRAPNYRLVATIPSPTSYGQSYYYVWAKK